MAVSFGVSAPWSIHASTSSPSDFDRRQQQRRIAVRVAGVHVGAAVELRADGLRIADADRLRKRRGQRLGEPLVVAEGRRPWLKEVRRCQDGEKQYRAE
jgi:hypothetical protein